jgi:hypothetical protein
MRMNKPEKIELLSKLERPILEHPAEEQPEEEATCPRQVQFSCWDFPEGLGPMHRRTGRGGGSPPSFFGQSGNIRSTVGQFWFEIKKNGTNSVNFG